MLINTFLLTNRLARLNKAMLLDSFLHWRSLCLCHLSSSSKVISSTFYWLTCLMLWLPISIHGSYENCFNFRLEAISINSVFLTFKVSLFAINQLLTLYKSLFSFTSMSAGELPMLDIFVSSANIDASVCSRQLGRSSIYNENNNGPQFDPRGTPQLIFFSWEFVPWTVHNWLLLVTVRFEKVKGYTLNSI
jgi:hypothetical protein